MQDARKSSGFAVSDRIALWWAASDAELVEALREHGGAVADEVLATSFTEGEPADTAGLTAGEDLELGLRFWIRTRV